MPGNRGAICAGSRRREHREGRLLIKLTDDYGAFERSVLEPLAHYRRQHDGALLVRATESLRDVVGVGTEAPRVSSEQRYRAEGWTSPSTRFRLSRRSLARLNPGYAVRVKRLPRHELGRWARLFRAGFEVEAVGARELPPFALRVVDRRGRSYDLPASNADARHALMTIASTRHDAALCPPGSPAPVGYVDTVRIVPQPDGVDRTTWLAAIVHDHPSELLDIVDSPGGRFAAEPAARLLTEYPANARWADRYAVSALGLAGEYHSDLTPLRIVRLDSPGDAVATSETVPSPVRDKKNVSWTAGPGRIYRPSPKWAALKDADLQDGGTVLVHDTLVVYEGSADPANGFVAGQWQTVFGASGNQEVALVQLRDQTATVIPEAILLAGRNDDNWFHWLIEYLPRVLMVPPHIPASVPLVVTTRTPPTGIQALRQLTDREIISIDAGARQRFGTLHVLAPQVQVLDSTRVPWSEGIRLNSAVLGDLRTAWRKGLHETTSRRRVFLQRNSRHRGIENEDVLAQIAHRQGLEIIDPGRLSFDEQLELFFSAELLVGASGAVMANYIMMQPGSTVLALTSDQLYDFVLPAALAQVAGIDFSYVTGASSVLEEAVDDRNHWIHADFHVEPKDFELALTHAIASLRPSA